MAFESWYKSTLATKLNPWDTSLTVSVAPSITSGRLYLKSWNQEEWMSFSWVDGNVLTGLTRELSTTSIPATSEWSWYTWTAWTVIRIVAMHDQITWWNMDTSNFNPSAWAWSAITFQWNTYTRTITPTEDFTIDCDNVVPWMTYVLVINTWVAYSITLWTWITNPYGEELELITNKRTVMVLLALSSSELEVWSVRTAV